MVSGRAGPRPHLQHPGAALLLVPCLAAVAAWACSRAAGLSHSCSFSLFCRGEDGAFGELELGFWFMRVELNLSLGWKS